MTSGGFDRQSSPMGWVVRLGFLIITALVLCPMGVLQAQGPAPKDLQAYLRARANAGDQPSRQVRLALWCEANGLAAERLEHLERTLRSNPNHPAARGLLGQIAFRGQWRSLEEIQAEVAKGAKRGETYQEYLNRRRMAVNGTSSQWPLALWCLERGLTVQARAHLIHVVREKPTHKQAWKRLNATNVEGRWLTSKQQSERQMLARRQRRADEGWRVRLPALDQRLDDSDPKVRAVAQEQFSQVTDPLAVHAIWETWSGKGREGQLRMAALMAQIDGPQATQGLAMLAVHSPWEEVHNQALDSLEDRDPREHVALTIGQIQPELHFTSQPIGGNDSPGFIDIEQDGRHRRWVYEAVRIPLPARMLPDWMPLVTGTQRVKDPYMEAYDPYSYAPLTRDKSVNFNMYAGEDWRFTNTVAGYSVGFAGGYSAIAIAIDNEIARRIMFMSQQRILAVNKFQQDLADIKALRSAILLSRKQANAVLKKVAGDAVAQDRPDWTTWWSDDQRDSRRSDRKPRANKAYRGWVRHAGFPPGTIIETNTGPRAIEALEVGDEVLAQDPKTGELRFEPVLVAVRFRPCPGLRIMLEGGHDLVATPIQRFWKGGTGWVMARDLQPGDALRSFRGLARIQSIEPADSKELCHLEIDKEASFFAGSGRLLVHDLTVAQPSLEPFDKPPSPATRR